MPPIIHPGRLLKRELEARALSANRLALDLGVPSGRITDILGGRRSISADTAVRLGRYFGKMGIPFAQVRLGGGRRSCEYEAGRTATTCRARRWKRNPRACEYQRLKR